MSFKLNDLKSSVLDTELYNYFTNYPDSAHLVLFVGVIIYVVCFICFGRSSSVISRSSEGKPSLLIIFGIFLVGVYTLLNSFVVFDVINKLYWFGEVEVLNIGWSQEFSFAFISFLMGGLVFFFSCLYFLPQNILSTTIRPELKLEFESFLLVLGMLLGMSLCLGTNSLVMFYVSLELQSFCLIILLFFGVSDRDYAARTNYFFIILMSSIMLLLSFAILYLTFGTLVMSELLELVNTGSDLPSSSSFLTKFSVLMLLTALLVKIGLFPMHIWMPDIYEVSSEFFLSLLATVSKIFGFMIIYSFIEGLWTQVDVFTVMYIYSVLSMIYGTLGALFEISFSRMLGFSAMAHMGYSFLVISSLNSVDAYQYGFFYIIVYIMSIFPILCFLISARMQNLSSSNSFGMTSDKQVTESPINTVSDLRNVFLMDGRSGIVVYLLFSTSFFGLAGLPPFAGFLSKFFMLNFLVASGDYVGMVTVGFFSIIGAFYYLRIVKHMFFWNSSFSSNFNLRANSVMVISSSAKLILMFVGIMNILFMFLAPVMFVVISLALLF